MTGLRGLRGGEQDYLIIMDTSQIIAETGENNIAPRAITTKEKEDIIDVMTRVAHYDLEDDERELYETLIRQELQKAACSVFANAYPYLKKIAVVVWSRGEGQVALYQWNEKEYCEPVEIVSDLPAPDC